MLGYNIVLTSSVVLFVISSVAATLLLLFVDIIRTAIKGNWLKLTLEIMIWNVAVVLAAGVYMVVPFAGFAFLLHGIAA